MNLQDALQQERAIDDRVIYKLNSSVPTESFASQISAKEQCMALYEEVRTCQYHMFVKSLAI